MKKLILGVALSLQVSFVSAENVVHTTPSEGEHTMQTFITAYLPPSYSEIFRRVVAVDGEPAELIRYQPKEEKTIQYGGTHFSTVIAENGGLKGFCWLAPQLVDGQLPGREKAWDITLAFLEKYAPDLHDNKELHWIRPHDETITVHGQEMIITGMKVKMRNPKDGRWFWVIVGKQQRPIIFERDIVWIRFPGKRQTEKWLHDAWLHER